MWRWLAHMGALGVIFLLVLLHTYWTHTALLDNRRMIHELEVERAREHGDILHRLDLMERRLKP